MLEAQLAKEETNVYLHYPDEEELHFSVCNVHPHRVPWA